MYDYHTVLVHHFHYVELFLVIRRKILAVAQKPQNVNVLFIYAKYDTGPLRTILL